MTDLEHRIFRIVTATRVQADIPGAILAEIERTHVLVERDRWERVSHVVKLITKDYATPLYIDWVGPGAVKAGKAFEEAVNEVRTHCDLEPIQHDAAESDTSETAT